MELYHWVFVVSVSIPGSVVLTGIGVSIWLDVIARIKGKKSDLW